MAKQHHQAIYASAGKIATTLAEFEIAADGVLEKLRLRNDTALIAEAVFDVLIDGVSIYAAPEDRIRIIATASFAQQTAADFGVINVLEGQKMTLHLVSKGPFDVIGNKLYFKAQVEDGQAVQGPEGPQGPPGNDGADGSGVPPGGTTDQVLAKASNTDYDVNWVDNDAGGGAGVDIQTFTASGTWNKPLNAKRVEVFCVGGGGGGGSGRKGATGTNAGGGSGGSGGAMAQYTFSADMLGSTEAVTVGTGGTGGAAQSSAATNGLAGSDGGITTFGHWIRAYGGNNGNGGTTAASGAGAATTGFPFSQMGGGAGGNGTVGLAVGGSAPTNELGPSGGGGGSSASSANTSNFAGGIGGPIAVVAQSGVRVSPTGILDGGVAGTSNGGTGGNGNNVESGFYSGGTGGGGGGGNVAGNGGTGGNGGTPGGGGGGGGGTHAGDSGAGGNGGDGICIVITYF